MLLLALLRVQRRFPEDHHLGRKATGEAIGMPFRRSTARFSRQAKEQPREDEAVAEYRTGHRGHKTLSRLQLQPSRIKRPVLNPLRKIQVGRIFSPVASLKIPELVGEERRVEMT